MDKKKILIIDDAEVLCQTLQAKIEENGPFEVRFETKPNLASAAIKQFHPDLILLDISMPEIDGVSLAIHLNKDPETQAIPVMFVTALAEESDFQHGDVFGGYQVIPKTVSTEKLIEAIHQNLAKK